MHPTPRHSLPAALLALLAALPLTGGAAPGPAPPEPPARQAAPPHPLPAGWTDAGTFLRALAPRHRPRLVVQASVEQTRLLILPAAGTPTPEWLTALAAATHAEWRPAADALVLTDTPGSEHLAAMEPTLRFIQRSVARKGVPFTGPELALLRSGGTLRFAAASPALRAELQSRAWWSYVDGGLPAPETLLLGGIYLLILKEDPRGEIGITFPAIDGRHISPHVSIPPENARLVGSDVGPLRPPLFPILPALPASLTGKPRVPRGLQPADLSGAPFAARLPAVPKTVEEAVEQAFRATGRSFLTASVVLADRPLGLGPRPPTVAEALRRVEAVTAADWKQAGGTLVLVPDPRLERFGLLHRVVRPGWLETAAREVAGTLDRKQRETLRETGRLSPAALLPAARERLRDVARLAFLMSEAVDRKAVALQGVALTLVEPEDEGTGERGVGYTLPLRRGGSRVWGTTPLEPARGAAGREPGAGRAP